MKRYDAWIEPDPQYGFGGGWCELYERTLGQYVTFDDHEREVSALTAELARVKAESLRVVVDGEACAIDDFGGECFRWHDEVCGESHIIVSTCAGHFMLTGEKIDGLWPTDRVQPVRLERWEDE